MTRNRTLCFVSLIIIASNIFFGCATPPPVSTDQYVWPPPPEQARIIWRGAYTSQLDLPTTAFRKIKELLAGEDTPISLRKPVDVTSDVARNKFYVADLAVGGIFVFDFNEPELRLFVLPEGPFSPIGLAIDASGVLYALDPKQNKIHLFDPSEKFIRTIALGSICKRPTALAVNRSGSRIYIADTSPGRLVAIDNNGNRLFSTSETSVKQESLNRPSSIAINSKEEIIIADAFNARCYIYNKEGTPLESFGTRGDGAADFQLIKAVAVDSDDNLHFVDGRANAIKIFNRSGSFLYSLGGYRSVRSSGKIAPGGFVLPTAISIGIDDRIYIVDQLNQQIQVFQYISESSRTASPQATNSAK